MRWTFIAALALAVVLTAGVATAQAKVRSWDDLSWWAQSGSTPEPVKDVHRSGYWWWPTEPDSNMDDGELWGNRGVVYGDWSPRMEDPPPPPPPPPRIERPVPTRTVPVFNHVLFEFDKSELKPEGRVAVDGAIASMKEHADDRLVIEGHTCNVGAEDYNMGLGQRRADAVMAYMTANGIAASRISATSKGESEPAVSNDTPASRKLNRRAVFIYSLGS